MRLYQQLVLFMLAATVLPLALLGFYLLRSSEQELARRIGSEQRAKATAAATGAASAVLESVDALARGTDPIDWPALNAEERKGALSLVYQQAAGVSAVVLVDAEGMPLSPAVFRSEGDTGYSEAELPALLSAFSLAQLAAGGKGQSALSPAFARPPRSAASLAIAVKLQEGAQSSFLLAELSLEGLAARLAAANPDPLERTELVDGGGRVLVGTVAGTPLRMLDARVWSAATAQLGAQAAAHLRVDAQPPLLVSLARLPHALGLYAVVSVDEHVALASIRALRRTVLGSIAAALGGLLLIGFAFTRRLNRRISAAVAGAEAFGRGDLSHRIAVDGADELSELGETFNRMGAELETSRGRLELWNEELKQRVEEAIADLKAAQGQLLQTQKLAAVGQLGAGVAHEINNPLAGILGHAQLLMMERSSSDPDFEALKKIEQSAKRCKEITQNLLRFSQQRESPELRPTDLNAIVRDALSLSQNQLKGEGVELVLQLAPGHVMVRGDPGHLSQVVLALVSNARTAMINRAQKRLVVTSREQGGEVALEVKDTGKGIKPEDLPRIFEPFFTTKDVWSNVGLGLSVAFRVMSEHQGRLEVATEVGVGSTFTVWLPKL